MTIPEYSRDIERIINHKTVRLKPVAGLQFGIIGLKHLIGHIFNMFKHHYPTRKPSYLNTGPLSKFGRIDCFGAKKQGIGRTIYPQLFTKINKIRLIGKTLCLRFYKPPILICLSCHLPIPAAVFIIHFNII